MRSFRSWVIGLMLLWAARVSLPPALAREAALDKAVLAADWAKVAALLEKDDAKAKDPAARLLMGHASLALNHDNAAALLFRSMDKAKDLAAWKSWTSDLAQRHPQHPVALYLAGDAEARLGRYDEAITTFTRVLELKPAIAGLALNARGLLCISCGAAGTVP